jgi:hypothetical protein
MDETKNQLIQTGFTLDRLHQDKKISDEAYTILKDRNKQAINYTRCCKSDSELLTSFAEYLKERSLLNVRKENIPVRIGLYLKRG